MKDIKLAVFDMAGTTVNEDNMVYKTLHQAILMHGFNCSLKQVLEHGAGKEKQKAIYDTLLHISNPSQADLKNKAIFKDFKQLLEIAYDTNPVFAFDNIEKLFQDLRSHGIKVVLNTGYDRKTANKLLDKLNWAVGRDIDGLITACDVKNGRPFPDMIHLAMKKTAITNSANVLKAGDSVIDIIEGKNAQCALVIAVLTGAQSKAELQTANPDYILQSLADLRQILLEN
ncbi:phosphonatase-like hydrolase [Myroides sp. LJL119]